LENIIWGLKDPIGIQITSFKDLTQLGSQHFQNIFSTKRRETIDFIIQIALNYPNFVEYEDNRDLMEEVFEEELKEVLLNFQK
jgi:hypothetical protein